LIQPAILAQHLSKSFDGHEAVRNVSFSVTQGHICGLIGGNGAGKTTTIAMLLGLLIPTRGKACILGVDMTRRRHQILSRINFSSPYVDLPQRLTVTQNLTVYGRLYNVVDLARRIKELAEALNLHDQLGQPYGKLSAGQKSRVSIAKALINRPEVLLLDEPTASMDPESAHRLRHLLMDYRKENGLTILMTSHNMSELEMMCDHLIVLDHGRVATQGSPGSLIEQHDCSSLEQMFIKLVRQTR